MSRDAPDQGCKSKKGKSLRTVCERTAEKNKEDVDDEADAKNVSSVLWEKYFEQSIFVDISDDDSLHLSDLQGSFRVDVSQGSAVSESAQTCENTEVSDSYEVEEYSSESPASISSEHGDHGHVRDARRTEMKASDPQPNRAPEGPRWRPEDDNTSDEDQEELPYDDELRDEPQAQSQKENSKELYAVNGMSKRSSGALHTLSKSSRDSEKENSVICNSDQPMVEFLRSQEPGHVSASVPEFLLRHFSQDELLNCSRLIEAETMPEVSLLESINETVMSRASPKPHATSGVGKVKANPSLLEEDDSSRGENKALEVTDSKTRSTETTTHSYKNNDQLVNHSSPCSQSDSTESKVSFISDPDDSPGEKGCGEGENGEKSCSASTPNLSKPEVQRARFSWERTRSCSELKYGQGQVHYPLPDFSKVAPKVKIPKGNGSNKPGCHTPFVDRTQTTAGVLGKSPSPCSADVISRVLEDSVWLTEIRKDEEKQSRLDQILQAEYSRLLAKYPEDETLINQVTQRTQASSQVSPSMHWRETVDVLDITRSKVQARAAPQSSQTTMEGSVEEERGAVWSSLPEQQSITEGQRLTRELTAIISQFVQQVEEFKRCISNMSMSVEEQEKMFKGMKEAQDQLERNYRSKKEEHRVLEMQNYMGLDRNTGQFDPDRQVEGEIFRLGMQLEDIKEQIDRNAHCVFSPPPSSSTPTVPPHGHFIPSSSHQPTLHKEPVFSFSTSSPSTGEEGETFKSVDEDPRAADTPLSCATESSFGLHISNQTFCLSGEEEEGSLSVPGQEDEHEIFLAQLTEPASTNYQGTPNRPEDRGSLTQDPSEEHANKAWLQSFVSPETDSGFGASDLSRPPTGLSHTRSNAESSSPSDVGGVISVSTSDNEASHSDPHTAISLVTRSGWPKMAESEPNQLSKNGQNMSENYITQNTSAGAHTAEEAPLYCRDGVSLHSAQLQEPSQVEQLTQTLKPTVVETPATDKHVHCSCPNSEAISALQYEVSRLKRALEDSLGHLPQLSMRMEHLSNMYTQEKRLRSRPRPRHQHRPPSSSRCLNKDLTLRRVEDWNSSDTEPNKSKGTDSGESDHSEGTHMHSRSPSRRRLHDLKYSSTASLESLSQDMPRSGPNSSYERVRVAPASVGGNVSISSSRHSSNVSSGPLRDSRRDSAEPAKISSTTSTGPVVHGSRSSVGPVNHGTDGRFELTRSRSKANAGYRPPGENLSLMDRRVPPPPHPLHKPLLQTSYGSCNSLPPGFKVWDQRLESEGSSRRRSTQSDSAVLPSNVYFQRTSPLPSSPSRTRGRPQRQKVSKEEAINRTLDKALEAALVMKQTTERMARTLSSDLAKARIYKKLHERHPLSGLEHP